MNVIDKSKAQESQGVDFDRFRLRRFLEELPESELETREQPTDLADVAAALDGNAKATYFRSVGPEQHELVGNVCGARSRIAHAFGVAPDKLRERNPARGCATSRTSSK